MPFIADVFQVMIASPSDVAKERDIIREVIHEWNILHASDKKCVLLPVGWETHSSPEMGDRPQSIINKQVLDDCDLLVGVFWTRLGTPTGESDSGTVEEIERHTAAGKPAMLYFSSAPVQLHSVNQEQYNKLIAFKEKCRDLAIIQEYETLHDFTNKFTRQLFRQISNNDYFKNSFTQTYNSNGIEDPFLNEHPALKLSKEGIELLLEAANSDGTILKTISFGGLSVQANNKQFTQQGNARSEALWESVVIELINYGLIQDRGKGEVFSVTRRGYNVADTLKASGM